MRALKISLVVVLLAPPATTQAQIRVRPGQYEYTLEMDLGGPGGKEAVDAVRRAAGAGSESQKILQCVTADDVKDMTDADSIVKFFAREMAEDGCKISDAKTIGNKLTYTATCIEDGSRMTMTTEMTFSGDSITGSMKGKDYEGRPMASKISARRVGECPD
jgi:Protein of unknown function (DUF3617)